MEYNPKEIQILIDKYFEGNTTVAEEQSLRNYFSQKIVSEELEQYRLFFAAWSEINSRPELLQEEVVDLFPAHVQKFSFPRKVWISSIATSAVAACLLLFFMIHKLDDSRTYVMIDGKKYTDEAAVQKAFDASIENVKIDMEDVFSDFQGTMPE